MKKLNYFFSLLILFCFSLNKSFAQNCAPATAQVDLDISNVRARILNGGDMWWGLNSSGAEYEVPKGSGKHSLFAGGLWIGGLDVSGNVRLAANTYRQSGDDFWPGPIDTVACTSIDSIACKKYDRLWKINKTDVINFIGGSAATPDMISYPGNGDPLYNQSRFLAPFYDKNGDGLYNTNNGDYPLFDYLASSSSCASCGNCNTLHGDQVIWWVINDVGVQHGSQIGLEIQCQAFAYTTIDPDVNNATFYQYKLINRNCTMRLDSTYFGLWVDPDLGNGLDDYIGCDVGRGMGYVYNSDNDDEGAVGYGLNPPAIGIDLLQGPTADFGDGVDNDRDGCVDGTKINLVSGSSICVPENNKVVNASGDTMIGYYIYGPCDTVDVTEHIAMSKFVYYDNNSTQYGNPVSPAEYYRYLRGQWRNGQRITYGGNGYGSGNFATTVPCDFMFPGTSDSAGWGTNGLITSATPNWQWDEAIAGNVPADRRFLMSAGPFTMMPGAVHCIKVGVPWARGSSGAQSSVAKLKIADYKITLIANNCFDASYFVGIKATVKPTASLYPNPVKDELMIRMNDYFKNASISIFDVTGQRVINLLVSGNEFSISCKDFSSGVYFYRINLKGAESVSGKFLKE